MLIYGPYMITNGPYMIIYGPYMSIYGPYMIMYGPYMSISEVGGKKERQLSPTEKSDSFRSCVRAGEAKLCVPARRCCFRGWVLEGRNVLLPVPVPFPSPA